MLGLLMTLQWLGPGHISPTIFTISKTARVNLWLFPEATRGVLIVSPSHQESVAQSLEFKFVLVIISWGLSWRT